jgi:hypothetical protein
MSVNKARRMLNQHGKSGNWRLKGLLMAGLDDIPVTAEDVARAWPKAKKGDYPFLQEHDSRTLEDEMSRTTQAFAGTDRYRVLKDYAVNADNLPKQLSSAKHLEEEDGRVSARLDDAIPRMLFASSDPEEIDVLFREQLLETVQEGREFSKVFRDAMDVIPVNKRKGDMTIASDQQFAPPMSQGSEIRDDAEQHTTVEFSCEKHGDGARVTEEVVDQANPDVIERNINFLGASVENAINRVALRELIDNAQNNHDTAGADQGYAALNSAVGEVDEAGFSANTYATGSQYRTQLFNDTNLAYANRAGTNEVLRNREDAPIVGDIAGLDMHASTHEDVYAGVDDDHWPTASNTFGFDEDGEYGAAVYNRNRIHIFMYAPNGSDIEIKDYDDPIRDLRGLNARAHVDCQFSQARSASTIEF